MPDQPATTPNPTPYNTTLGIAAQSFDPVTRTAAIMYTGTGEAETLRMDDIVKYQLKRAAASGGTGLGTAPVDVLDVLKSLRAALLKVYAERGIECDLIVSDGCTFVGDREDLTEIAGNLLDNAFKFCRRTVRLSAQPITDAAARRDGLRLIVEDDGPGIAPDKIEKVLQRGVRGDERVQGHGIGLSIVQDIVHAYKGELVVDRSPEFGGARFTVTLTAS